MPSESNISDVSLAETASSVEPEEEPKQRREPLTRRRVIETALRLMDEEGLEALSMRRIGRELGVEAMSLYNHVRDKEDILDGITELVMTEFEFPEAAGEWRDTVLEACRAWRRMLKAHPKVLTLLSERKHPMESIDAFLPMEHAFAILRSGGLSDQDVARAYSAFGGYIFGFVLMEVGNVTPGSGHGFDMPSPEELRRLIPADRLPHAADILPLLCECDWDEQFDFGIRLLMAGLEATALRSGS
jgi:AcrR family transcriptional regulator